MFFLILVLPFIFACSGQQQEAPSAAVALPLDANTIFVADKSWNGYESREDWNEFKEKINLSSHTYSCRQKEPPPSDAPVQRVAYLTPGIVFTSIQLAKNKPVDAAVFMMQQLKSLKVSFNEATGELSLPVRTGDDPVNKSSANLVAHTAAGVLKCQKGFVEPEKQVTAPEQKSQGSAQQATK